MSGDRVEVEATGPTAGGQVVSGEVDGQRAQRVLAVGGVERDRFGVRYLIEQESDGALGPDDDDSREPMVKILFALAIAATSHQIQKTHAKRPCREEAIDIRWRQLGDHLGHEPARTPPRT
jgi:hypothetical protein